MDTPKRNRVVVSEGVGDADDMRIRADREAAHIQGLIVVLTVVVQGWLRPDGKLWEVRQPVTVKSPSLLIGPSDKLGIKAIVFSQDQSGTKTTLTIVNKAALGILGATDVMQPAKVKD